MSNTLKELRRKLPDGVWKLNDDNQLLDPDGNIINFDVISPVERKLFMDFMAQSLTRLPYILYDVDMERNKIQALFKELRHTKSRVKESYRRGVEDSVKVIESTHIYTPSARNVLETVSKSLTNLIQD